MECAGDLDLRFVSVRNFISDDTRCDNFCVCVVGICLTVAHP